jgi:hypothetical protein
MSLDSRDKGGSFAVVTPRPPHSSEPVQRKPGQFSVTGSSARPPRLCAGDSKVSLLESGADFHSSQIVFWLKFLEKRQNTFRMSSSFIYNTSNNNNKYSDTKIKSYRARKVAQW